MSDELTDYERGYLDGLWAYGWWKDGVCYVGTTGRTYQQAVQKFLREQGKESWAVRFGKTGSGGRGVVS